MGALDRTIQRLERDLQDSKSAYEGILSNAADNEREPNETEKQSLGELTNRMDSINKQLSEYDRTEQVIDQFQTRAREVETAMSHRRREPEAVAYETAGAYIVELVKAASGSQDAKERLDVFTRAAAHQKTSDNLGVIPDPIVGDVVNFIDSARPLVTAIGVQDLPSATFYRPIVTQNPSVAVQGSAGAAADEKAELVSQKMTLTRLTATAVTYGGYVNVSRQNIDFSTPSIMDIVVDGLAAQYAIQTEAAVGTKLDASTGAVINYGASPTAATITTAVWSGATAVYTAVKGQGRLILALAPDRLAVFGPLFPPIAPANAQSQGLFAGNFMQGPVGAVSGIQVVMSAGLGSGKAFIFSTAAIDVFEQRIGTLQVTEPSVLGVQVAYAGYFTTLILSNDGIRELVAA